MKILFNDDRFKNYKISDLKKDFIAGITVGIVAIPLAMAFAIASGVKPEYGLYTTIIAGFIVSLIGGSRFQIAGPTGAFIPILLAIVIQYGYEKLLIAGFLAGILLLLMGVFKLGNLITYIPRSVTIGFTAGIAVIIFTGQLENFFGLEGVAKKEYFHENMAELIKQIQTINLYSILTALLGLAIIIIVPRFFRRVPILLVALLIPTIISAVFYPTKVETIGSKFGGISQSLPTFHFPELTFTTFIDLLGPAFVIAILGGIESLLSAVVADGMTGTRHHSNKELVGQGVANMVTPLFGGIPATGAIARTATNINSGAVSPLSGIIHSVFVLLTILVFAPFASYIPLASMASILMIVAWNMSERREVIQILKLKNEDSLVLALTFLLTVFINLTVAVEVGLILAMLLFIKRMSHLLEVEKVLPKTHFGKVSPDPVEAGHRCPQIMIYTIHGPLFFGAANKFERVLTQSIHKKPKVIILRMRHVSMIDATGENQLRNFIENVKKQGGVVILSGLQKEPLELLMKSGLYQSLTSDHIFKSTGEAITYALSIIDQHYCQTCKFNNFKECASFKKEKIFAK